MLCFNLVRWSLSYRASGDDSVATAAQTFPCQQVSNFYDRLRYNTLSNIQAFDLSPIIQVTADLRARRRQTQPPRVPGDPLLVITRHCSHPGE
jgi:hypothetical protein